MSEISNEKCELLTRRSVGTVGDVVGSFMRVAPLVAVLPLVLQHTSFFLHRNPVASPALPDLMLGPSGQLEPPGTVIHACKQRNDGGEGVDASEECEETLLHKDTSGQADRAVRDTADGLGDPVGGELEGERGQGTEAIHTKEEDDGLISLGECTPSVTLKDMFAVHVEGDGCEAV